MRAIRASFCMGLLLLGATSGVVAQTWPSRPIVVISAFSAGNAADVIGRVVLDQASRQIGQPFVIENRPGGGGTVGVNAAAKAEPDGYTVLLHSSTFSAQVILHKNLPYDPLTDFVPVVPLGIQPLVLVTGSSKPFKSAADLIAAAKANPGSLNYASAGIGATSHMAALGFLHAAGIKAQHIPFRGPTEAFTEVVSGRVDFFFLPLAPALHLVKDGKVRALVVGSAKRAPALPDVPTTAEIGLPGAAYHFWTALFVPAKTPSAIIDKLHAATAEALKVPVVQERLSQLGVEPLLMGPEQFAKYFRDDVTATVKLAKEAGIGPAN